MQKGADEDDAIAPQVAGLLLDGLFVLEPPKGLLLLEHETATEEALIQGTEKERKHKSWS